MTAALQTRYPGVEVMGVQVDEVIVGSATKLRLRLSYATGGENLPERMVLKAGFDDFMRELAGDLYRNEAVFFGRVAPRLATPLPRCFFAAANTGGSSVIVIEDLIAGGATFGDIEAPLTVDQMATLLELLASVHGAFWDDVTTPPVSHLTGVGAAQRVVLDHLLSPDNWDRCLKAGRFEGLPVVVRDQDLVAASILSLLDTVGDTPRCLIHGDAHLGNLYFEADRPRLLDWQAAQAGRFEADVSYAIICCLDTDVRRQHERDLLEHYREHLAGRGVASVPSPEATWVAYRRHAPYGLLGLLCTPEMQSETFARVMGARFAWAVDDLGSLGRA